MFVTYVVECDDRFNDGQYEELNKMYDKTVEAIKIYYVEEWRMKIPKECDICSSPTIEGSYGESKWLCTNKQCKKNNPNWSFNEAFEPYKERFTDLENKIGNLSQVKIHDYDIKIKLHEARWIGNGSGDILIKSKNLNSTVRFYFYENKVEYDTVNVEILNLFKELEINLRLKDLLELKKQRDSMFWERI